ncbi:MAG: hypothetical protein FWE44_00705 [Defluviitaleaceae bacterium]|nr:hypothetical protein [Defluviitaleaceae bacterium]
MKRFTLSILLLVASFVLLAACGARNATDPRQDVSPDNPLIGSWDITYEGVFLPNFKVLNADGTGHRGFLDIPGAWDRFVWWTDGDTFRMNMTSGATFEESILINNESWTFTLAGDNLTLESNQERGLIEEWTRTTQQQTIDTNSPLIGMWDFDFEGEIFWDVMELNANGTGVRWEGTEFEDRFDWWVDGNNLYFVMTAGNAFSNPAFLNSENWSFTLLGDVLTLTSRQAAGHVEVFIRAPQ